MHNPHPVCGVLKIDPITPQVIDNQQGPEPKTVCLKLRNAVLLTLDGEETQRFQERSNSRIEFGGVTWAICQAGGRGKKDPIGRDYTKANDGERCV